MSFLDNCPLDWQDRMLKALKDLLASAYPDETSATALAKSVGLAKEDFPIEGQNMRERWEFLMDELSKRRMLRQLVEKAVTDPTLAGYHEGFTKILKAANVDQSKQIDKLPSDESDSEADPFRLLTQQCKDGIAELRKLTGKKPEAFGFVFSSANQIVLRKCCIEIGALHILKELHLKFDHLERVIRSLHEQSTRLSETPRSWSDVTEVISNDSEMGLKNTIAQIDRLLADADAKYDVPDAISWRESLIEAHNNLKSAAKSVPIQTNDEVRTKTIKNAFDAFLRELFNDIRIPKDISFAMANRVVGAHLGELSVILHKIYLDLTDNSLVTDDQGKKIAVCEDALNELNEELTRLVHCHSSLQKLDLELRPFLSTREYQLKDLEASWPKITKPANMVWRNCQTEVWRTNLESTIVGKPSFDSAWAPGQIETDFHRFQDSFTDLDKRLMKLCDAFYEGVFKPITDMMPTIMGG